MMMVLCFLMCIPLKMMAKTVTIHYIDEESWKDIYAYVYQNDAPIGDSWPRTKCTEIKNVGGKRVATWTLDLGDEASDACVVFNNGSSQQHPAKGVKWTVKYGAYYNKDGETTAPTEGGGGGEGGGTTTTNPLSGRVYTQGYYLAVNFFSFSGDKVTYNDAVFKFQQQKDDAKGNDVYKVEIPASLTAHAQVMSVDAFGKIKKVYGPGSAYEISNTRPETGMTTSQLDLKSSETQDEGTNYWDIKTRNERADEYSDGMYEVYITVDKTSGEPANWYFKHIGNKRVAFFISDDKYATAMPLYDTHKDNVKQFSDKFFASVNLSAEHSYYVISNYVMADGYVNDKNSQYGALVPDGTVVNCPTTNKLFLLGNGGHSVEDPDGQDKFNRFSPNEEPMKPASNEQGSLIIEYNPSNGTDAGAKLDKHLGICGRVHIRDTRAKLTSVSLVGDAIPGTVNDDGTWNYASTAADMTYDETEKCYKVTLVTKAADGKGKFRFVGNHNQNINWHEDSNDDASMMAKTPYNGDGKGHAATSYDPNKVNYTEKNENSGDDWGIIWNRPAGRWTVRLFFYTRSDGNNPVTDYYYTISKNEELELRDFEDVVYMSPDNKRNILFRGDYKYFRTWSAVKAWKISKDVDIFVVNEMKKDEKGGVTFSLKNINHEINADPTYNVIPANTGVILATTKTADQIDGGAVVRERASLTSYNTMVIPMEEYSPTTTATSTDYKGDNRLKPLITAQVVPTKETNEKGETYYNYLFGFYNAKKGLGLTDSKDYKDNDFLLGFWISNGTGSFYNNSACLPVAEADVTEMGLGVSYNDFDPTSGKKNVPALFFDFANADGTTGIDEVVNTTVKNNDGKYYTLSGQQVEKPTAGGIYIHNGKKFVVR
mgnify:FL=1